MDPVDDLDRAIQRRLADDDPRALELIYDRHAAGLYAYAASLVGREGAEDVIQELFAAIARHRPAVARAERLPAYLTSMVRNLALDWSRRRRQGDGAPPEDLAAPPAPEPEGEAQPLHAALEGLPAGQREVVVLRIWKGLTLAEIAGVLGIGLSTAGERWQKALAALRSRLTEDDHA